MMSTACYLRANRLLDLIRERAMRRAMLLKSRRYSLKLSELYGEQEARLRRYLLELMDNESRRAA